MPETSRKICALLKHRPGPPRGGGRVVQCPRGPWTLGGPWASGRPLVSAGPAEGLWAREGPIEMTLGNQHVRSEAEMETGRVDRPVGLPVGSRFFDRPVKSVKRPVKFFILATKRHLSTNRNVLIYFIINKTFYKKNSINKPHLSKALVEWFQAVTNMLWPLRHAHPGTYLGWEYCSLPPHFGSRHKAKKCKICVKVA